MLKIVEIAKAWIAAANPTPEQQEIAEYRASICDACPKKAYTPQIDLYYCSECGCPLKKKVFSPLANSCPLGKWEK